MAVSSDDFNRYCRAIEAALGSCATDKQVRDIANLASVMANGDTLEMRNAARSRMAETLCGLYARSANLQAAVVDDFCRSVLGIGASSMTFSMPKEQALSQIGYMAGDLFANGDANSFSIRACDWVTKKATPVANQKMEANCEKAYGKGKVRYALVPAGGDICTFCLMLASRGFVYTSGVKFKTHDHCTCKLMPETKGGIEGYDPDSYYKDWKGRSNKDHSSGDIGFGGGPKGLNIAGFEINESDKANVRDYLSGAYGEPTPMTFEEADGKRCNPHFGEEGYGSNCQTSVFVYEMRRRGYNIEALPRIENETMDKLADDPMSIWVDRRTGRRPRDVDLIGNIDEQIELIERTVKEGHRYSLAYLRNGLPGHVVSVERDINGNLFVYDPQSGYTYLGDEVVEFLSNSRMISSLCCVDDADFNIDIAKDVVRIAE